MAVGFRERLRKPDDVLPALAQRGDPQGDNGKPVEEIREEEIRAWEEMPIEEQIGRASCRERV